MGLFLIHLEPLTNMFIHHCSSLENCTQIQAKMGKVYTHFQTKWHKNPTFWGGTYLYGLYKGVPPFPRLNEAQQCAPCNVHIFIVSQLISKLCPR